LWLAAACSRTQCSRGIPEDHPAYQTFLTLEQTGQVCIREVEALERAGFEEYSLRDYADDWLSRYDSGVQRWIGLTRMLSGAGIVAGSWLTGVGVCAASSGIGCGAGAALAAGGTTLGISEASAGAKEWNDPKREDPAQRVANAFDPDTHPGERSLLLERGRSLAWVAGESLAAGVLAKLGLKLVAVEVQRPVDKVMMQGEGVVTKEGGKALPAPKVRGNPNTAPNHGTFTVTKDGVVLVDSKHQIPDDYIQNPYRLGSYGEIVNGKFKEKLRIDPATPAGQKGPNYSHYHKNGKGKHYSPKEGDTDPGF
ncbi:MAG: hypothetical protein ACR2PW_00015, partial [Gammaproteobacteria bacterium]